MARRGDDIAEAFLIASERVDKRNRLSQPTWRQTARNLVVTTASRPYLQKNMALKRLNEATKLVADGALRAEPLPDWLKSAAERGAIKRRPRMPDCVVTTRGRTTLGSGVSVRVTRCGDGDAARVAGEEGPGACGDEGPVLATRSGKADAVMMVFPSFAP